MMTTANRQLTALIVATLIVSVIWADDLKEGSTINKLVGTWKAVSAKYGGEEIKREEGVTHIKHVTPTQFMWATCDKEGKVSAALGGSYTFKGDKYVELPEYGTGDVLEQFKGKPQEFTWKVEGCNGPQNLDHWIREIGAWYC